MRRFRRLEEPPYLASRWEQWGIEWEKRRNRGKRFHWHQLDGEQLNHKLLPPLKQQTEDHCSFCDAFPVSPPSIESIEHFLPKSKFPLDAYRWGNLYYCCSRCQCVKGERYEKQALRPDDEDYEFDRYFSWDWTKGSIEVNKRASKEDQIRAQVTIQLYDLNQGHPSLRKRELLRRSRCQDQPLDDFAYRDYVDTQ